MSCKCDLPSANFGLHGRNFSLGNIRRAFNPLHISLRKDRKKKKYITKKLHYKKLYYKKITLPKNYITKKKLYCKKIAVTLKYERDTSSKYDTNWRDFFLKFAKFSRRLSSSWINNLWEIARNYERRGAFISRRGFFIAATRRDKNEWYVGRRGVVSMRYHQELFQIN